MNHFERVIILAGFTAIAGTATMVQYNTTASTLLCGAAVGCTQNDPTSLTVGGLTLTYNADAGSTVDAPSIINLGNITTSGSGTGVDVTGLMLSIQVYSNPPSASGTLPTGIIQGSISANQSGADIEFWPNNTTTLFGTLPGVDIVGGGVTYTYQVLNPSLGVQDPNDGDPHGLTTIQGTVMASSTPEPAFGVPLGAALCGLVLVRRNGGSR